MTDLCDAFSFCIHENEVNGIDVFWFSFGILQCAVTLALGLYAQHQYNLIRKINESVKSHTRRSSDMRSDDDPNIARGINDARLKEIEHKQLSANLILPVYIWYMWLVAGTSLFQGITNAVLPLDYEDANPWMASILNAGIWALHRFSIEAVAFFLLQHGAGVDAMKKAALPTIVISLFTFFSMMYTFRHDSSDTTYAVQVIWEAALFLFYMSLLYLTPHKIYARPALHQYARFWAFFRLLQIVGITLKHTDCGLGYCWYDFSVGLFFGICKPIILYRTFQVDSLYWQGLVDVDDEYARAVSSDSRASSMLSKSSLKNTGSTLGLPDFQSPLLSQQIQPSSAVTLVQNLNKSQFQVRFLNFAHLSIINRRAPVATGGTSSVYRGLYKGLPVAIKVIQCKYLTPETINNFFREATFLSGLKHRNVVFVEGACIVPPSISLVMEFCDHGSLFQVLSKDRALIEEAAQKPTPPLSPSANYRLMINHVTVRMDLPVREPLGLHRRLLMAADCFRGLAFLHSQQPPILHKDIKSLNFLVDRDYVVKIADLELSTEKSLTSASQETSPATVHWTAPEILTKRTPYNEKCDVYSTGVVFWEIMTSKIPFAESNLFRNKAALSDAISGPRKLRPEFPLDFHPDVRELIDSTWHFDPEQRPTASEMCESIESLANANESF